MKPPLATSSKELWSLAAAATRRRWGSANSRDFTDTGLRGCGGCTDLVSAVADLSVGNVGTPDGETAVVVRTERGQLAWERTTSLAAEPIDRPDALTGVADWNRRRAESLTPRSFDPDGSIGISAEEHRGAYDGTDREPKPLNPARVHQYDEWC